MKEEPLALAQLQEDLAEAGHPWQMAETPLTALSERDRVARLGVTPPPGEPTFMQIAAALDAGEQLADEEPAATVGAPAAFDLRNVGGKSYVTKIKDQGGCGSCVAFGTIASVESTAAYERRDPSVVLDLSEAHLFYCHARAEGRNCGNGWWPENALKVIRDKGVTFEDYYPYTAGDQNCSNLNADWPNRLAKVAKYQGFSSTAAVKEWISTIGAVEACMVVYQDFFAYKSGVYKHVSGNAAGGHCVCLIGYDDAQGCWIGKNSWGTGWGEAGYFRIKYGECGIDSWLGPLGVSGVSAKLWRNNVQVRGLWTNEANRNAWVYLTGVGWRKIAPDSDQVTLSLLSELIAAKAAARPVNVFDDGGTIKQLYVL